MGIIDFVNKYRNNKENKKIARLLSNASPIFSHFGNDVYASDVVQQAISCIVFELKKLTPLHIRLNGADPMPVKNSKIQYLLNNPNERMTTSDFIEKVFWSLFINYNSYIIPTYEYKYDKNGNRYKDYTGLYPIQPTGTTILQDTRGEYFIQFRFLNGYETTLKYSDVIHLKYRYSVNEFMGGNEAGQPDNKAILKTLELNHTLLEGVSKGLKASFAINGVIKHNTLLDDEVMEEKIEELEKKLKENESGFLGLDIKGEYIPINNKIKFIDADTLKFIDEKILRNYGVSLPILTGDYTKGQYEAFYQKTIEPLIISISQMFTKVLFTDREKAYGNEIKFYPHELIFMSTEQKLSLFDLLVDSASCYTNELRTNFGMMPLPELVGQIAMSSNKTNAENNKENDNIQSINESEVKEDETDID